MYWQNVLYFLYLEILLCGTRYILEAYLSTSYSYRIAIHLEVLTGYLWWLFILSYGLPDVTLLSTDTRIMELKIMSFILCKECRYKKK